MKVFTWNMRRLFGRAKSVAPTDILVISALGVAIVIRK